MLVVLASVTTAERMKRILYTRGIKSEVVQTPKSIAVGGCGYSLRMNEEDKESAVRAAKDMGVRIKGFYREEFAGNAPKYTEIQDGGGAGV